MFFIPLCKYFKASAEGSFLGSSVQINLQHFFRLFGIGMLKCYMDTVYENVVLIYINMLGIVGWNILSTENVIEIMRGQGQKIRQTKK